MDPMSIVNLAPPPTIPPADQLAPYVNIALTVFTAVVSGAATLLPVVIPILLMKRESRNDDKQQAVEADVKRAGLIAASVAAEAVRVALEEATSAESEGGVVITAGERKAALERGVVAGLDYLKGQKLYERAIATYGTADRVESSIRAIVGQRALGNSHGIIDDLIVVPSAPKPLIADAVSADAVPAATPPPVPSVPAATATDPVIAG